MFHGWYAVLSSKEVSNKRPLGFKRFGINLVAWRNELGRIVVMEDLCPHRSVKLSLGHVKESFLTCPFHGFRFDDQGNCALVPEIGKAAPNLRCTTFLVREQNGFIWVWYGDVTVPLPEPPWFEELDKGLASSEFIEPFESHITRCIENQLDYAHLPFVHKSTIGKGFNVCADLHEFELTDQSIRLQMDEGFFEFKFPNIWMLQIVPKRFFQFIAFAPVDEFKTLLYVRSYQRIFTTPILREVVGILLNTQSRLIIAQDKHVVLSHPPFSSLDAAENLYRSDQGIRHFRKYWRVNSPVKSN